MTSRQRRLQIGWVLSLLTFGCAVDLEERLIACPDNDLVESIQSWGTKIALTPEADREWHQLVKEPWRSYGIPPITIEKLQERFGAPSRISKGDERGFIEYLLPAGRLRFALEEDRSGSDIHQSWRLRLFPNEQALADFLEEAAYLCLEEVIRPDFELLVLDRRDRRPKVEMKVRKGRVQEIIWINLGK